jgi:Flagellar hook-length control protein FliK
MAIVISPTIPLVAAQGVTADVVLQPGSVISARVLQILGNDTARIAIGNQSIDVLTQVPLQAGQTLQLSVSQGADGSIRLAVVNQGDASASPDITNLAGAAATADSVTLAPSLAADLAAQTTSGIVAPKIQLTPQEALAVSVAAQTAATQQTSLAPLFANLDVAAGLDGLPPPVQQAVAQLLTQRISLDQGLTGDAIRQAFQSSGLFLEASLASGSLSSSAPTPDLKAALIVLRQVLTTSLDNAPATLNAPTPAAGMQQGTTAPAAAQQGAAPATIEVQQGTSPPATAAPQGTASVVVVLEQGIQPSVQVSSQSVAMIVEPETSAMGSSALVPLLASGITASGASLQAPMAQDALTFSAANAVISPTSTPAGEVARAAVSSAALNLLQEVLQAGPLTAGNPSGLAFGEGMMLSLLPVVTGVRTSVGDDAEFARTNMPPPPISGALPAAQPVMPATLVSNSSPQSAMQHLLADTDAPIARQTLLQVASLPDRVDVATTQLDPTAPRWNFEIPFATRQGTAMAQFEISRDGSGSEVEAAKRVWRARFSLDVEPAGPVHAMVSLSGERTSVRMWAERPATADQLRAGVSQLSQALSRAELQPGDIVVRDGAPLQSAPARAGHFLDRAS